MPTTKPNKKFRDIMSEAASGKSSDQSEMNAVVMQNMTKFLPIMMFFIMISLPGALALYYTVSNLVAVAQQGYLLRQDEEELEELVDEAEVKSDEVSPKVKAADRARKATEGHVTRIVAKDSKMGRLRRKS